MTTRNYTDNETNQLVSEYQAAKDYATQQEVVRLFAVRYNKPESSIRSKLVKLGKYEKEIKLSAVTKKECMTKIQMQHKIENLSGLDLNGLDKAPKLTLDRLLEYIICMNK